MRRSLLTGVALASALFASAAQAANCDEASTGDLSGAPAAPTSVSVSSGSNAVSSVPALPTGFAALLVGGLLMVAASRIIRPDVAS